MAITDKSRKIVWGRSGNRCAICRNELVVESTTPDDESVVGEECHIVSGKPNGPRYLLDFPIEKIDEPENLLLLCRIHHKVVDDQTTSYTIEQLRTTKSVHERWVAATLAGEKEAPPIRIRRTKDGAPEYLTRLLSGRDVINLMGKAYGHTFDNEEPASQTEVDLFAEFFQEAQDYGDLSDEYDAATKVQCSFRFSDQLRRLEAAGYWAFGGTEMRVVTGGIGTPSLFPIAHLRVTRKENPEIVKITLSAI